MGNLNIISLMEREQRERTGRANMSALLRTDRRRSQHTRWVRTESEVKEIGAGLVALLSKVGFQQVRLEFKPMKPIATVCALGIK